jgi:cell division protein FtsB
LDRAAARRHTIEAALWISMVVVVMFGISFFEDSGSQAAKIQALERENAGLRHEVQQLRTGVDQR